MSSTETYALTAFPNGKVQAPKLIEEIKATPAITKVLISVKVIGTNCLIEFDAALAAGEKTALDGVVAAHQGLFPKLRALATLHLFDQVQTIATVSPGWQVIGRCVFDHFLADKEVGKFFNRISCEAQATGGPARLRVTEVAPAGGTVDMKPLPFIVGNTGGAFNSFIFALTVAPRIGANIYQLEGHLNGAASAAVRSAHMICVKKFDV